MAEMHDTTEEYLESILAIEEEGVVPMRARLVERLGLSAAAVSETIGRLSDHGFVELHGDRSLHLTDKGRSLATTVVRRHRLAERLLVDVIGLEWEKVHREADRWEHAISADVEEKLVELLGDPATCPHGNPIPGSKHRANGAPTVALAKSEPGPVVVRRVNERLEIDDEGISLIAAAHLMPGSAATVVEIVDGSVTLDTETGKHTLPKRVAENLYVSTS
jgi:DtxR family transcriptional regulator, Mn-dependent transcriptional regulator